MFKLSNFVYSLISGLIILLIGVGISISRNWNLLMNNVGGKTFGDLRIITSTAGCISDPSGDDFFDQSCSSWATDSSAFPSLPYNYPKIWAEMLVKFSIDESQTFIVGLIFVALYSTSIAIIIYISLSVLKNKILASGLLLFASLSPGALLGLERGNFDLLVFFILILGIAFSSTRISWMSVFFFSLASILKIFPIGSLLTLLTDKRNKYRYFVTALVITFLGMAIYFKDLIFIGQRTPLDTASSFGIAVLPLAVFRQFDEGGLSAQITRVIGFLLFAFLATVIFLVVKCFSLSKIAVDFIDFCSAISENVIARTFYIASIGTFGVSYLLGTNYEYRIIFLIPALAALIIIAEKSNKLASALLIVVTSVFLLTNRPDNYQLMGDLILLPTMPLLMVSLIFVLKNPHK